MAGMAIVGNAGAVILLEPGGGGGGDGSGDVGGNVGADGSGDNSCGGGGSGGGNNDNGGGGNGNTVTLAGTYNNQLNAAAEETVAAMALTTTTMATATVTATMMITTTAAAVAVASTTAAPTNRRPLPSGALVNCRHPPLLLLPLVGRCTVVRRPISLSLVTHCCAIVDALVAGRFHRQSSTAALRWSRHQPPPAFTSSDDGWLLHRRPPLSFVVARHRAIVDSLVATQHKWIFRAITCLIGCEIG
jgi:hypothetical protein